MQGQYLKKNITTNNWSKAWEVKIDWRESSFAQKHICIFCLIFEGDNYMEEKMLTKPQISERTNSMTHINHWNSVEKSTELKLLKNSFRSEAVSADHFVLPSVCRSTCFEFFLPFLKRQCPSPYNVILYVWICSTNYCSPIR